MYVVESGKVQMSRHGMIIGVLLKGSFFGESALQPGRRIRDRSAYALQESSLAMLRKRGALVVDVAPDKLTSSLLGRYLEIKARRLL